MSLLWLQPLGLLALAAVLLPLLAHLRRATEAARIDFAALRWLQPRRRPRRRLRLREWFLLLLRILLVVALALLLAEPARVDRSNAADQVFVAPTLAAAQARAAWPALPATAQWHWLAPGLPSLDTAPPRGASTAPLASLLREADARAPAGASLHVLVPAIVEGLDGARPRLAHRIEWRVVPLAAPRPASPTAPAVAPTLLAVRGADADPQATAMLRAVASAWMPPPRAVGDGAARPDAAAFDAAAADAPMPARSARLVWIGVRAPPALQDWVAAGGTALLLPASASTTPAAATNDAAPPGVRTARWRRDDGTLLADATPIGRGQLLRLRVPLTPAALPEAFEAAFPRQLARLFDGPPPAPTRGPAGALQPLAGGPRFATPPTPLAPAWALAIALLFLVERVVATRPRRDGGA